VFNLILQPLVHDQFVNARSLFQRVCSSLVQRQSYEENGFILIKNLIPADRIQLYTQRFLDIANGTVERQPTMLMMRDVTVAKLKGMGEKSITKLQDFQDDEILFQYCAEPVMLPIVQSLIGDDVKSMHTMLINKPPDTGKGSSRHPPHQVFTIAYLV
jgi:phytanoyl-CoA hydroxylase